jgi:hypothetical protein
MIFPKCIWKNHGVIFGLFSADVSQCGVRGMEWTSINHPKRIQIAM